MTSKFQGLPTKETLPRIFWRSSGFHLLKRGPQGWLEVTGDFLLAYFTRPEVHPIETSCDKEIALHEALLADPFRAVPDEAIAALADPDARESYRFVLAFRDALVSAGTVEGAYLKLMRAREVRLPPVFLTQLVHVILRNALANVTDPIRLRAAEVFFREQVVSTEGGGLLLADEEIVELQAKAQRESGLAALLAETGTPQTSVALDVLDEDNAELYWDRSDRYDTVIDMRFEQPGLDAMARVIETWLGHLLALDVRVEPRPKLEDKDWRWHIGLDAEATRILNQLYEDRPVSLDDMARIVALFRMRLVDDRQVIERVRGRPIYLALAMTAGRRVVMKPQNLLTNLPLRLPS